MRHVALSFAFCVVLGLAAFALEAQDPQRPPSTADPYAGNAAPGATAFPARRPGWQRQQRRQVAPPGAANQGAFDPADVEVRHRVRAAGRTRRSGIR